MLQKRVCGWLAKIPISLIDPNRTPREFTTGPRFAGATPVTKSSVEGFSSGEKSSSHSPRDFGCYGCLRQHRQGIHSSAAYGSGYSTEEMMIRRQLLTKIPQLLGLGLLGLGAANAQETTARKPLKIMMKSAWGSDDPTRASFVSRMALRWPTQVTRCRFSSPARLPTSCGKQPFRRFSRSAGRR